MIAQKGFPARGEKVPGIGQRETAPVGREKQIPALLGTRSVHRREQLEALETAAATAAETAAREAASSATAAVREAGAAGAARGGGEGGSGLGGHGT